MTKNNPTTVNLNYFWKKKTILSFAAILFIVAIHNSATNQYQITEDLFTNTTWFIRNLFAYGIGSIAVPFFFFISGLTFFRNYKPKLYKQKMISRINTLLIPYLIWNLVGIIFAILYTFTPLSNIISGREQIVLNPENIFQGIFFYKYNYHFWFMYSLIVFVILTPFFHILLSKKWLGITFIPIFLCLPLISDSFLHISLSSIVFYYLGCFIGRYYLEIFTTKKSLLFSVLSGITALLLLIIKMLSIYHIITLPTVISQLLLIILLLAIWFFADIFITKRKAPKFTDEFFPVYTIHPYIIAVIVKIIILIAPHTSYMLLINEVFSTILTMIITTACVYCWHKVLPKTYSIFFGRPIHHQNNNTNIV